MNRIGGRCSGWLACLALAGCVSVSLANADLGPYQKIIDKNPFDLKPPEPPKPPPPIATNEPVNVTLTGIASIGAPKAFLVTKNSKGESEYHTLAVGERASGVEVLGIDEKNGTVKVRNLGKEVVLNFQDHGAKMAAAPTPQPPRPGLPQPPPTPGRPPVPAPTPGAPPSAATATPGQGFQPVLGDATGTAGGGDRDASGVLRTLPTRTVRTSIIPQNTTVPHPPQPNFSAEESAIIMEATRIANEEKINRGQFPPLPPLPGSDQ